jgi:hypothetical protein
MNKNNNNWFPEIVYEDDESTGLSSKIPFIMVPEGQEMPRMVFIFESRQTGEFEPGQDGEELPIYEMDLHQYADMSVLKTGLTSELYDTVRGCLGLAPLRKAAAAGKIITNNIRENLNQ